MRHLRSLYILACCCVLLPGCSASQRTASEPVVALQKENEIRVLFAQQFPSPFMADAEASYLPHLGGTDALNQNLDGFVSTDVLLVDLAKTAIGTPYKYGGENPGGFDCSGLIVWTYRQFGLKMPRKAQDQGRVGEKVKSKKDLRVGDLVTFRHPKRGHHIGIYVGDGNFLHSPSKGKRVTITSLESDYFKKIYTGARRVTPQLSPEQLVEVKQTLEKKKVVRSKPSA